MKMYLMTTTRNEEREKPEVTILSIMGVCISEGGMHDMAWHASIPFSIHDIILAACTCPLTAQNPY